MTNGPKAQLAQVLTTATAIFISFPKLYNTTLDISLYILLIFLVVVLLSLLLLLISAVLPQEIERR